MTITTIKIKNPNNLNLIFGQSHFIKTVEDLHEAIVSAVPSAQFGLAFSEASGSCMIRTSGTDEKLQQLAADNLMAIKAGHTFIIFLKNCFPINVLTSIKNLSEVCQIYCATANKVEVIIYQTRQGRAVLGVVDGSSPKAIEQPKDIKARKDFLRNLGYKL